MDDEENEEDKDNSSNKKASNCFYKQTDNIFEIPNTKEEEYSFNIKES